MATPAPSPAQDAIPPSATSEATQRRVDEILKNYESKKKDLEAVSDTKKVVANIPLKLIKRLLAIPFRLAASFDEFDGWILTDDEADELASAWKPIFDQYLPAVLIKWLPLLMAVAVTLEVLSNKVKARQKFKKANAPVAADKTRALVEEAVERRMREEAAKAKTPGLAGPVEATARKPDTATEDAITAYNNRIAKAQSDALKQVKKDGKTNGGKQT